MGGLFGNQSNAANPPNYVGVAVQTSSEGMCLPVVYGRNRISTNVIWSDNFQKVDKGGKKGGGKGGGKGQEAAEYYAGVILACCEGPVGFGIIWVDATTVGSFAALNLVPYNGDFAQTPFGCISTLPGFVPLAYRGVAYLATNAYDLGPTPTLPQHNFEILGFFDSTSSGTFPDVNPATIIVDICTSTRYGLGIPSGLIADTTQYATYCAALNLLISPALDQQEQAISIFQRWAQLTNTWIFWSENQLKFCPLGDTTITANGVTYTPITVIRYALTLDDFVLDAGAPLTVIRSEPSSAYNWTKIDARDRLNQYSTATAEYKDQTSIDKYGLFQANSISADEVCDRGIAGVMVGLIGARALYIRNSYKFTLPYNFVLLEPGDIVSLTDIDLGLTAYPVRIRSIAEDDKGNLAFEAEECPSGTGTAIVMATQESGAIALPARDVDPGAVNPPAVFEPPTSVSGGLPQIWIGASGGTYWGGANVYLSVDDMTYVQVGSINKVTPQGVLLAPLASHADPDTVHTLSVDLIESLTALAASVTHADADAGRTLAMVDTEVLAYGTVAVNSHDAFSSDLTYLRRGLYGSAIASHTTGAPFAAITPANMLKIDLPAAYVGVLIYLKLASFNIFGSGAEDISSVTRYEYTPLGVAYSIAPPTSPALVITTAPGATSIAMTLTWIASVGPNLGSGEVQFSADSGATWTAVDAAVGAGAVSFTLNSATASTNYQARVRAISADGRAASTWATSAVVNSGIGPTIPSVGLPLVNGDVPIGIVVNTAGVPVYVPQ